MIDEAKSRMDRWFVEKGNKYKLPLGRPHYIDGVGDDTPFPSNPAFKSQKVLSQAARWELWSEVREKGQPLKAVSARYGVDIRRVAAVVRLMDVEKRWRAEMKPTASLYAKAVMRMLPQHNFQRARGTMIPHEPINDVHVHALTEQQLFVPVAESHHFTREDAAKAFGDTLLPTDRRVPHPELVGYEKSVAGGARQPEAFARYTEEVKEQEVAVAEREQLQRLVAEKKITKVPGPRCEFRFQQIQVDDVGPKGRSRKGTGWRYGAPFLDRKRGTVWIPTKVE